MYSVYICNYEFLESITPRHFITGISPCRKAGEVEENNVKVLLPPDKLDVLTKHGEVVITDVETLKRILSSLSFSTESISESLKSPYVYMLVKVTR